MIEKAYRAGVKIAVGSDLVVMGLIRVYVHENLQL